MKQQLTSEHLRKQFKRMYMSEFNDPNESFMDYMLDLIDLGKIKRILKKGKRTYYSNFEKYK